MSSGYYPAGAENDPRAPWNETDIEPVPCEVDYSCTLRRTATVEISDYIPGYVEKEWDGESYVAVRADDGFSDTNWLEEFKDTWRTPLQLIEELRKVAEEFLKGNVPDKSTFYWQNLIADCKDLTINDEEAETT